MNKLKFFLLACVSAGCLFSTSSKVAAADNTVVRFQLRYGPNIFGNVDVELFDFEKPITVSNFLYYVETGAYDRSILHRVKPGFVVQGGQYTVENPYASTLFNSMNAVPEGPAITNEFNVGPVIHNTFGTLTMAKIENQPDSATSSWFFNLGDNSDNLDAQNGGFTVFGRVKSGAKYLSFFNTISENDGIINMSLTALDFWFLFSCDYPAIGTNGVTFDSLPVTFFPTFACPFNSDLFTVQISVISSANSVKDGTPPKVTITYPTKNLEFTNESITVRGTVTDTIGVGTVRVYLNANSPEFATVTNNTWSLLLTNVPPGPNAFLVEATDTSGNRATTIGSFFRSYSLPFLVGLAGTGTGSTTGPTNGQLLEIRRAYSIVAKPDAGNLFVSWVASLNVSNPPTLYSSGSPTLNFIMETNLQLVAKIDTNLFPYITGTFNGLFVNTNEPAEHHTSGYFTLQLADRGGYSAKILLNGRTLPFSGTFNSVGDTANTVDAAVTNILRAFMKADISLGSDQITGYLTNRSFYPVTNFVLTNVTITNLTSTNIVSTNLPVVTNVFLTWSAALSADRTVFKTTNPAPLAGAYTMIFPADSNSAAGPGGDGYGTVKISTAGAISFKGSIADGTKAANKTFLSKNGSWPFYVPLYKGKGSLISWVTFDTNQPDTDFSGLFNWFKQTQSAKYYANGFTAEATIAGSRFTKPASTARVLDLTNAVVGFTNGNLAADFANGVTLDEKNKINNEGTNALKLGISTSQGTMSGSVTPPTGGKAVKFNGVILQKQNSGSGYFINTNSSGRVSIQAR